MCVGHLLAMGKLILGGLILCSILCVRWSKARWVSTLHAYHINLNFVVRVFKTVNLHRTISTSVKNKMCQTSLVKSRKAKGKCCWRCLCWEMWFATKGETWSKTTFKQLTSFPLEFVVCYPCLLCVLLYCWRSYIFFLKLISSFTSTDWAIPSLRQSDSPSTTCSPQPHPLPL